MINNRELAAKDEKLFHEGTEVLLRKRKLTTLIDALFEIEDKVAGKGYGRDIDSVLKTLGVASAEKVAPFMSKTELALLMQVAEKKHTFAFYNAHLEETVGKEIALYESMSQQLLGLSRHKFTIIELIRHSGGTVVSFFDRLVNGSEPIAEHLTLRHSVLVPDLFVVLQNQKRVLRNRQWSRFKRLLNQEKDIIKRLKRQLVEIEDELRDMQKLLPGYIDEKYYGRFFAETEFPLKLVSFVLLIQVFLAKARE